MNVATLCLKLLPDNLFNFYVIFWDSLTLFNGDKNDRGNVKNGKYTQLTGVLEAEKSM
jgi:hypothetical protein